MRSGYSDKDKRNFAKLSVELGVEEVARMAGVSPPVLSRWRLQFGFANRLLSEKEREKLHTHKLYNGDGYNQIISHIL